jgi:hypothetical protein
MDVLGPFFHSFDVKNSSKNLLFVLIDKVLGLYDPLLGNPSLQYFWLELSMGLNRLNQPSDACAGLISILFLWKNTAAKTCFWF